MTTPRLPSRLLFNRIRAVADGSLLPSNCPRSPPVLTSKQCQAASKLLFVSTSYADGEPDTYVIPVVLLREAEAEELLVHHPHSGIMRVQVPGNDEVLTLCEGASCEQFWQEMLMMVADRRKLKGMHGRLFGIRTDAYSRLSQGDETQLETF